MKSYKDYFTDQNYLIAFFGGLLLFVISVIVQFFTSSYAARIASGPVTDIILSNTRVYDVDGIFVYGTVVCFLIVIFLLCMRPRYIPFIMKSIATFVIIRSIFTILTHISPYSPHIAISSTFFSKIYFDNIFTGNDLFFSGHTGMPFLLSLIFWDDKLLRYIFLAFSLMFAVVVLLGHLHYSIDVLSAFFITYSIYHICLWLFKREHKIFLGV